MTQPAPPILVRVIGPPTEDTGLGDVILQALGLTGVIAVGALVLGLVLGGAFILLRRWRPRNAFNGETAEDLSLHLQG